MRLYQTGALLTGARSELDQHAGVLVDGTRTAVAGPLGSLAAEHATPPDAATLRAARALGVDDRTGTIEAGKDADPIAVRGDPRSDVSAVHHVELVVARDGEHRRAPRRVLAAPAGPGPR